MVWCFEDRYKKWIWKANEKAYQTQLDDTTNTEITQEAFDKLKKAGTEETFTTKKGGQKKYAGVTPEGKKRFKELREQVTKNRVENAELIKEVEDKVLLRVRKAHSRDEMDKKKKGKGKKKKAPVLDEESDVDSDDENF